MTMQRVGKVFRVFNFTAALVAISLAPELALSASRGPLRATGIRYEESCDE